MSKSILLSIKPKWCAKIMNGKKTIELRKNKALANAIQKLINENGYADIYVYCSKDDYNHLHQLADHSTDETLGYSTTYYKVENVRGWDIAPKPLNGKVAFKFRCYKVEEIKNLGSYFLTWSLNCDELLKNSCLNWEELFDYLRKPLNRGSGVLGYAIHISDLEIVNKELYEFKIYCSKLSSIWAGKCDRCRRLHIDYEGYLNRCDRKLRKAPQNFVYIEIEQNEKNNI